MVVSQSTDLFHLAACGARALGLFSMLPLGWDLIGLSRRFSLAVAVALFMAPHVPSSLQNGWALYPIEFGIGAVLGLPTALLVEMASSTGELFDTLRGQTVASAYDPLQQSVSAYSAVLTKFFLWALLLQSGVALHLFGALVGSYYHFPLGGGDAAGLREIGHALACYIPVLITKGCLACLPFGAACFLIELIFAFMAKQLSSVSFQGEIFLVKYVFAVLLAAAALRLDFLEALTELAQPTLQLLRSS